MRTLGKSFVVFTSIIVLFCSVILFANAVEINQNNVPIKTNTEIVTNGNHTDIKSNTTVGGGSVGVNTFGKFNVENGEVVNLHLIGSQTKLINLIYDSSPSQINGIVNSYMNGKIGGNVLFANPNGFVIGADGVFNVGSLTLVTPTQQSMESFINDIGSETPSFNETQLNKLISFSFNGDNYLVCGDTSNPIKLEKSLIEISGKINSANGIDIISGGKVEIKENAQLNANLDFNYKEDGTLDGFSKKTGVTPNLTSSSKTFAMNDGNGIIIVSSNDGEKSDYLSAFVNLNGSVDANGSNIIVKSEASNTNSSSNITVDGNINANEIYLGSDGSISSTSAEIVANTLEVLANNEISLVNSGNLTISSITSKNSSVSLKSLTGSININDLNSKTDANINAVGDVTLATTKIGTALNVVSTNFEVTTDLGVGGKITITSTGDVSITSKDKIVFDTLNVNGTFDAVTKGLEIITGMDVGGKVTITATGNVVVTPDVTLSDLEIKSAQDVTFGNLKVLNLASITNDGKLTLGTGEFKDITINSGSADITSLKSTGDANLTTAGALTLGTGEFKDITINSDSADITSLKSTGDANLTTTGALTLGTGDFVGVTISSGSADITNVKATGEANLTTTGALTLGTGDFAKVTMTSNNGSVGVSNLTSSNNVAINSNNGNTTLGTLNVDGTFGVVTKNLEITTGMDVGGKVTITATGDINISPDVIFSDLEISANKLTYKNLTVNGTADITVTNDFTANDVTINNLNNLSANNITINNLTVKNDANIVTKGLFKTETATVSGNLTKLETNNAEIGSLTVTKDANIKATGKITANTIDVSGNLSKLETNNAEIGSLTVGNDANIKAIGKITADTIAVTGNLSKLETKDAEIGSLTATKDANIKATGKITADTIAVTGNLSKLETKDADIKNLTVNNDTTIVSNGDVILGKTTIGNDFNASAKNLTFNGVTSVTGETSLKATNKLTFVPSDVTFNNNLTIAKGTGIVAVNHLTVNGDADINSNGKTTINTANITGNLKTNTNELVISDKLTVDKTANLGSKTSINVKDAEIYNLITKNANNVKIDNLKVDTDADIQAFGKVELGTIEVGNNLKADTNILLVNNSITVNGGKASLKATEYMKLPDLNLKDLTIEKGTGNVDIGNMNIVGKADINSNGKTTIKTATVQGDLTTDTNELEVVNKLTVTNGDTYLGSNTLITLHDAELDNLKMNAHDAIIDNMVVHDYVDINANGDVSIKTANVEGLFTSKTANLEITDKLTADENVTASNSIKINNADIEKDLNTSAKTITIDEMNLKGKFNSEVDTLSVNTSNDLNIATIFGNSKAYTNKMYINSDKAILNALDNSKDINIYAKNIKMISNTNTATEDKPLNLKLAKNNNITLLSNGDIEIFTTGAVGNYRKIVTDYLDIKTDSYGVNVYSAIVNIYGDIRTANKHIIIDNTTWAPNLYVTLQLRSIISPHFLFVNRSPFIRTQSLNALRHGMNIYVNKTKDATSMNSWLVSSAEAQLKTSNTAKKFFDKTDSKLNVWSTLDSYISNNFSDEGSNMVIKTIKGEIMTPDNMDEFVNSNHNDIARPKRRLFRRNKTAETIQVSYLK